MRRALITGGSRGIGAAAAEALAQEGWETVITYLHSGERALALAARLGGRAIRADVADPGQTRALMDAAGPVDALVCCAGIAHYGLITDTSPADWRRVFAVNCDGVYNCARAAIPGMVAAKRGAIVTVSSVWGNLGASCEAAYAASKAGIIGLTKSLARELGPSGIRANCVAPGVIDTDMMAGFSAEDRADLAGRTALGRLGAPGEVAELIAFLCSDRASFITGQVIGADGGFPL